MKERNRQEDLAILQLKDQQNCLKFKKILGTFVSLEDCYGINNL